MKKNDLVVGEHYAYKQSKRDRPQEVALVSFDGTYYGHTGYYSRHNKGVSGVTVRFIQDDRRRAGTETVVMASQLASTWAKAQETMASNERYQEAEERRRQAETARFNAAAKRINALGLESVRPKQWVESVSSVPVSLDDIEKLLDLAEIGRLTTEVPWRTKTGITGEVKS